MPNFLTSKKWPTRRVIGLILGVIVVLYHADQWATAMLSYDADQVTSLQAKAIRLGETTGTLLSSVVWGSILYYFLRDPDEPKGWHGVPRALLGILFFVFLPILLALFIGGNSTTAPVYQPSKTARVDACILQKMKEGLNTENATTTCISEIGMTQGETKALLIKTLEMADGMSVVERIEWCKTYLPHFWKEDMSQLDVGCNYLASNWAEMKARIVTDLNK